MCRSVCERQLPVSVHFVARRSGCFGSRRESLKHYTLIQIKIIFFQIVYFGAQLSYTFLKILAHMHKEKHTRTHTSYTRARARTHSHTHTHTHTHTYFISFLSVVIVFVFSKSGNKSNSVITLLSLNTTKCI